MELSIDHLNLGDGTKLGEVPTLQGLDFSRMDVGVPASGRGRQYVRFYKKQEPEVYATEVEIKPLGNGGATTTNVKKTGFRMVDKEFVHIVTPGEKTDYDNVVTSDHKRTYFREYQAFLEGKSVPLGMPLEDVVFLSGLPGIVTELKLKNCHTLEQLADASDLLCSVIPDGYMYREYARTAVQANLSNQNLSQVNALQAELKRSQEMISQLQTQMSSLLDAKGKPIQTQEAEPEWEVSAGPSRDIPKRGKHK